LVAQLAPLTPLQVAGYVGLVCGCSAIYTALAEVWEEGLGIRMPGLAPVRFI
jgi:succinate-acetate transporter protein